MTWRQVWHRRLKRHSLLGPAQSERMLDAISAVCGIHAQVASSAELSIGLRVTGVDRDSRAHSGASPKRG